MGMKQRRWQGAVLAGCVGLFVAACKPALPPPPPPPTVIVYGDSLTNGSQGFIQAGIAQRRPGWRVVVRSYGGTAICDWFGHMQQDSNLNARLVVIQFSGNLLTPCVAGIASGSSAHVAKYTADAHSAASIWTQRGVKVLFVGNPGPFLEPPPLAPTPHLLDAAYELVATARAASGVSFSNLPEMALAVPDLSNPVQFVFPLRMPCLSSELTQPGCVLDFTDNTYKIQVRDGLPPDAGSPTLRGHFCPVAHASPCPVYASGAFRFGDAIAAAAAPLMT